MSRSLPLPSYFLSIGVNLAQWKKQIIMKIMNSNFFFVCLNMIQLLHRPLCTLNSPSLKLSLHYSYTRMSSSSQHAYRWQLSTLNWSWSAHHLKRRPSFWPIIYWCEAYFECQRSTVNSKLNWCKIQIIQNEERFSKWKKKKKSLVQYFYHIYCAACIETRFNAKMINF